MASHLEACRPGLKEGGVCGAMGNYGDGALVGVVLAAHYRWGGGRAGKLWETASVFSLSEVYSIYWWCVGGFM